MGSIFSWFNGCDFVVVILTGQLLYCFRVVSHFSVMSYFSGLFLGLVEWLILWAALRC